MEGWGKMCSWVSFLKVGSMDHIIKATMDIYIYIYKHTDGGELISMGDRIE